MKFLMNIPLYGIATILVLGIIVMILAIIVNRLKDTQTQLPKLDQYTNDFYLNELDKIIESVTVFNVDVKIGNMFSSQQTVKIDIPNEELTELHNSTVDSIHSNISDTMRTYLISVLGEKWFYMYVRINTMSLILNYSKLSIENMTAEKFKK